MQCTQLIRLVKGWYIHVKDETMAPARMMQFVDKHVSECETCQMDPDLQQEVEKIRAFVVPESKIPKAIRIKPDGDEEYEEEEYEEADSGGDEEDEDQEEEIYDDEDEDDEDMDDLDDDFEDDLMDSDD